MKSSSYNKLALKLTSLEKKNIQEIEMNFFSIEEILGKKLPFSAYKYKSWWSNNISDPTRHSLVG